MDNEHIDRVLSGDTKAFSLVVNKYKDTAFNLAVSIVKDDHLAEEVVQDAFLNAYKGLKSFNRNATFKSWFYRIIVNESFKQYNRRKKQVLSVDFEEHPTLLTSEEDEVNPKLHEIQKVMKSLLPNESLVLTLFYLEENSLKEVQKITGWSLSNTKVILHRARKNLKEKLGVKTKKKN